MRAVARQGLRTWIEIDRKALAHNFGVFKTLVPKRTKLMAVVKSNAYGHGLVDFSREMERQGADFLGVDSITEALALRREGIALPILVLGYTLPEMIAPAVDAHISLTVSSFEALRAIGRERRQPKIHLKVDTGMHRQGFLLKDLPKVVRSVRPEGLYTHFAAAKNPAFPKDTENQLAEFKKWSEAFRKAGHKPILHAAATAGAMLFPASHLDMVRIGIGLYGLWPAKEIREYLKDRVTLSPALAWKSVLTEIKKLPKGERVGYDLTETLLADTALGVIPIGYWHGYPRALSSIGRALIRGRECRVVGRVSMDMLTVDLTSARGAKVGDEVTILGTDSRYVASAEGIAALTDSAWYEVITRLNPLIKRIYI